MSLTAYQPVSTRTGFDRVVEGQTPGSVLDQVVVPVSALPAAPSGARALTVGIETSNAAAHPRPARAPPPGRVPARRRGARHGRPHARKLHDVRGRGQHRRQRPPRAAPRAAGRGMGVAPRGRPVDHARRQARPRRHRRARAVGSPRSPGRRAHARRATCRSRSCPAPRRSRRGIATAPTTRRSSAAPPRSATPSAASRSSPAATCPPTSRHCSRRTSGWSSTRSSSAATRRSPRCSGHGPTSAPRSRGRSTAPRSARLRARGVDQVIVDSSALAATDRPTPTRPFTLEPPPSLAPSASVSAVASDSTITALFLDGTVSPALRAQRVPREALDRRARGTGRPARGHAREPVRPRPTTGPARGDAHRTARQPVVDADDRRRRVRDGAARVDDGRRPRHP